MAQPLFGAQGKAKVDKLLSQFSIRYTSMGYVADKILPVVTVKERTGLIAKYGKDNLRIFTGGLLRAPGTRARTVEFSYGQGSYVCKERSVEAGVAWEQYKNTDDPYDPARDATANIKDLIAQDKEYAIAQVMANTAIFTQGAALSGTSKWSDTVNSTPIDNLFTGIKTIFGATGRAPNALLLGIDTMWALKVHPQLRDYVKFTNGGQLTDAQAMDALKAILNIDEVIIGSAVYNSASEGQTDVMSKIWGGMASLFYRPVRPTLMEPAVGYTITDVNDVVDGWAEPWKKRDMFRDTVSYDQNVIDAGLAYVWTGAV